MRLIAGLIKPSDGKITMPRAIRKGVIIENPAFIDEFSGFENLCYLASISKTITPEKIKAEMQKRCPEYTQFAIVDTDFSN